MRGHERKDDLCGFLVDEEIRKYVSPEERGSLVCNCSKKVREEWVGEDTQIQPASIDLFAGEFYPSGENSSPCGSMSLGVGKTCVIETREILDIPSDFMGLVFTPTSLTLRGILMPTAGHIDPGFRGKLRLLAINMGNREFHFDKRTRVATVLLFKLRRPCCKNYLERENNGRDRAEDIAARLSSDFAGFEDMASRIVDNTIERKMGKLIRDFSQHSFSSLIVTVIVTIVVTMVAALFLQVVLEKTSEVYLLKKKIYELEEELKTLK